MSRLIKFVSRENFKSKYPKVKMAKECFESKRGNFTITIGIKLIIVLKYLD